MSRSSVIYKYGCPLCGDQYVGSTSRSLFVRVSEHGGRSHRTGALLTCPPHSAIRDHCEQTCLGPVSYDDFNILAVAPDLVSLRILESLHIFKSKPKLNDSNSSFSLNIVLEFFSINFFLSSLCIYLILFCIFIFFKYFSPDLILLICLIPFDFLLFFFIFFSPDLIFLIYFILWCIKVLGVYRYHFFGRYRYPVFHRYRYPDTWNRPILNRYRYPDTFNFIIYW